MGYKEEFIELLVKSGVLQFGDFVGKSGRQMPYFINTGNFKSGRQLSALGKYYAACYYNHLGREESILFGPAYKGIPLVSVTATALAEQYDLDVQICFNRKEVKDHGEGGLLVGRVPQKGDRIVIVEDVITAGTAIRESMGILNSLENAKVSALIIAVDRMERGQGELPAMQELESEYGFRVYPIVTIQEIVGYLYQREVNGRVYIDDAVKTKITGYLGQYGAEKT